MARQDVVLELNAVQRRVGGIRVVRSVAENEWVEVISRIVKDCSEINRRLSPSILEAGKGDTRQLPLTEDETILTQDAIIGWQMYAVVSILASKRYIHPSRGADFTTYVQMKAAPARFPEVHHYLVQFGESEAQGRNPLILFSGSMSGIIHGAPSAIIMARVAGAAMRLFFETQASVAEIFEDRDAALEARKMIPQI